jgi:hypothetical protein
MTQALLDKTKEINDLLIRLSSQNEHASKHYALFREKYRILEDAVKHTHINTIKEIAHWNRNYAPRIIYEGLGNKDLLTKIIELDQIMGSLEDAI